MNHANKAWSISHPQSQKTSSALKYWEENTNFIKIIDWKIKVFSIILSYFKESRKEASHKLSEVYQIVVINPYKFQDPPGLTEWPRV